MIIELCIILRITLNENQQNAFQGISIDNCKDYVVLLQTTKDVNDIQSKPTTKISVNDYVPTPDTWEMNPDLKSLWVYRPPSIQSQQSDEQVTHRVVFKVPHLLTRLAKPLSYGFDPFFHKALFEPFERRPKPVTLVSFRKNGILPRQETRMGHGNSAEVAEMQSAYNDISSFWHDVPGINKV